ncbi:MAG: CPBP family intramembrane metalloprotease [Caldilineales bacterium]|nr:CPBP family intramembrane metalloprotease [Caldilineales bacterium]
MNLSQIYSRPQISSTSLLALTWALTLFISELPDILLRELTGGLPGWLFWLKVGLLAALATASLFSQALRPLRDYFLILLVIFLAGRASVVLANTDWWQGRFVVAVAPFGAMMLGEQLQRLAVSLAVIAAFLLMRYRRRDFFLVKGQLDAVGAPIRWLGITRPYSYRRFGPLAALCIALGLGVFLVIDNGWPALSLPALPVILFAALPLAALNAFSENMTYRAAPLATLEPALGPAQAMLLGAAFFGIGHYYGVPYGVIGVIMAFALGWILNKTMLETRGFAWPWFIHFCQDALVFSFIGLSAVTPGG